jgi:hypothetical protein
MPATFGRTVLAIIATIAIVAIIYLIVRYVGVATLRDLAIIFIALLDIILLALLVAIAYGLWRLVDTIRSELPPVIGSVKKTATTVEGTADFVSTTATMPLIRAVSLLFATTRFFQVLLSRTGSRERQG